MRFSVSIGIALFVSAAAYGEFTPSKATVSDSAGATSNVLLTRLGAIQQFSSGSMSPNQRDLDGESTVQDNTIFYSALTLSTSSDPLAAPSDTDKGLGLTEPGDSGVVTGGMQQAGQTPGPAPTTPSPASSTLALLGMAAIMIRRR